MCWIYKAGFMFSTFVSIVFWGYPISAAYDSIRRAIFVVRATCKGCACCPRGVCVAPVRGVHATCVGCACHLREA